GGRHLTKNDELAVAEDGGWAAQQRPLAVVAHARPQEGGGRQRGRGLVERGRAEGLRRQRDAHLLAQALHGGRGGRAVDVVQAPTAHRRQIGVAEHGRGGRGGHAQQRQRLP